MTRPLLRRLGIATAVVAVLTSACTGGSSDVDTSRSDAVGEADGPAPAETTAPADTAPVDTASVDTAPVDTAETVEFGGAPWTLLGSLEIRGIRRDYVLVDPGLTDDEIVEIVDELRALADAEAEPKAELIDHFLMDDDSQIDALLDELPNTASNDYSNWPYDYVDEHTVAQSRGYFVADGEGGSDRQYWLCRTAVSCDVDETLAVYPA